MSISSMTKFNPHFIYDCFFFQGCVFIIPESNKAVTQARSRQEGGAEKPKMIDRIASLHSFSSIFILCQGPVRHTLQIKMAP